MSSYDEKDASANTNEACVAGIDEAGRGPVLASVGPLVYAICYTSAKEVEAVQDLDVADSKSLTAARRQAILDAMFKQDKIGWIACKLDPEKISNNMLGRTKINLNTLSHQAIVELVAKVLNKVALTTVWVDTVGPPESLKKYLCQKFPKVSFTVSKKADSLYPMVSAASIIAKVTRDRELHAWQFVEKHAAVISREFGSGYPGDPLTISWMKKHCDPVFGYPKLIRFSWSTSERAIVAQGGVKVVWPETPGREKNSNSDRQGAQKNKKSPNTSLSIYDFFGKKVKKRQISPIKHSEQGLMKHLGIDQYYMAVA